MLWVISSTATFASRSVRSQVQDPAGLLDTKRRGGLVQENDPLTPGNRPPDGDGLTLTTRQQADRLAQRREGDAEPGQGLAALLVHAPLVQQPQP